jgi:hypothetical protein
MKRAIVLTVLGHFAILAALLAIFQGNPAQGDTPTVSPPAPVPALVSSFPCAEARQTLRPVPLLAAPVLLSHRPSDTPCRVVQGQAAGRRKILDEPMKNQAARSACTPPSDGRERSGKLRPHV